MCGRFTLTNDMVELQGRFAFEAGDLQYRPRYNVAPGQRVLVVTRDSENRAGFFHWGLIPPWAKDPAISQRSINARGETVAEKRSFRGAFRRRRCLILADGFYEWRAEGSGKTPMRIVLKSREPFGFAGVWEEWKAPSDETIRSCAIITTAANSLIEPIHNRMPVILHREEEALWLDPEVDDPLLLTQLLVAYPAEDMEAYPVSPLVNSYRNDTPACIEPLS